MPTSLEHSPKYRCKKVNRGRHTLKMRMNGTRHDIPNRYHLRENGRRKEGGGGLKEYITKGKKVTLNLLTAAAWPDHLLTSLPFLLTPRRSRPGPMCVHEKAKTRKPTNKRWKENA